MFAPHHCEKEQKTQDGNYIHCYTTQINKQEKDIRDLKKKCSANRTLNVLFFLINKSIYICVSVCVYINHCTVVNKTTTNRSHFVKKGWARVES